jgi:hypothetical protein
MELNFHKINSLSLVMHSNMEPKLNNISTKTSFNDFTPCWLYVIFYHTYVTNLLQNQCHVIYIYIVRLVHTCTKYWPLRGFENKWNTIASRIKELLLPNYLIILVLKKIQRKHYPNGLMGLSNPLLFGPINLTFTLIVMTKLPYLHLVVH